MQLEDLQYWLGHPCSLKMKFEKNTKNKKMMYEKNLIFKDHFTKKYFFNGKFSLSKFRDSRTIYHHFEIRFPFFEANQLKLFGRHSEVKEERKGK
jgi:hypothetical protein